MKRIITTGIGCLAVAVFFTGCNSLAGSMEVDLKEIQTSAAKEAMAATNENGESRLGMEAEEKKMPDYFQQNMTEKFKDLGGKQAFVIKNGHSNNSLDIESFEIEALKDDKTFIYGYSTRVEDTERPRKMVHCGAFYNYESGSFKMFHENVYARPWEDSKESSTGGAEGDEESFFLQVCDATGDIFVYDNGYGFLYDGSGNLKMKRDIESFVRTQFEDVYSVSVVNAATDGENRIYLGISIEKEKIDIPEEENNGEDGEITKEMSDRDLDKETEKLDKEVEDKVENRILVYEFKEVNTNMNQSNLVFEVQKNAWIAMTEGREFTEEEVPDELDDWNQAVSSYPDFWGDVVLEQLQNLAVYQWKTEESFISEDGVTNLLPVVDSYKTFRDLQEQWQLENIFVPLEGKYSNLFGNTGNFTYYNPQTIERTYTLTWTELIEIPEETVELPDATIILPSQTVEESHSEERTQILENINISRYTPLKNGYVESYWIMDKEKAVSLGKCIGNEIQCTGKDGKVRWIQPGGSLKDTSYTVTDETEAGVFLEDGIVYYVEYGKEGMSIVRDNAHGGEGLDKAEKIIYANLDGSYQSGGSAYDAIFEKKMSEDMPIAVDLYGNDFFTDVEVLHARLQLNGTLAANLRQKGDTGISTLALTDSSNGFLLTSQGKGLIFYAPFSQRSAVLEEGTWFRTWKITGNKYVSVGFPKRESSYSGNDVAHARVYEYDLTELCNQSMEDAWEEMTAMEKEDAEKAMEESLRAAEELQQGKETEKSPLEQWNETYKEMYEETYPDS